MEVDHIPLDISKQLVALIKKNFPNSPEILSKNTSLVRDLDADSLDMVDFILSLEDTFDIAILDEELESLLTFESLQSYICNKLNQQSKYHQN